MSRTVFVYRSKHNPRQIKMIPTNNSIDANQKLEARLEKERKYREKREYNTNYRRKERGKDLIDFDPITGYELEDYQFEFKM